MPQGINDGRGARRFVRAISPLMNVAGMGLDDDCQCGDYKSRPVICRHMANERGHMPIRSVIPGCLNSSRSTTAACGIKGRCNVR
jgi:hypothetical protein